MSNARPRRLAVLTIALFSLGQLGCQRPTLRPLAAEHRALARASASFQEAEEIGALPELPAEVVRPRGPLVVEHDPGAVETPMLDAAIARAESAGGPALDDVPPVELTEHAGPVEAPRPVEPKDPLPPAMDREVVRAAVAEIIPSPPSIDPEKLIPTAEESWADLLERLREVSRREAVAEADGPPGGPWRARSLALEWLAGASNVPPAWTAAMGALASGASRPGALKEAIAALESLTPLAIEAATLCQRVHGFGQYEEIEPTELRAGRSVILYCEMSGLRYVAESNGFRSRLVSRVEVRPRGEAAAVWSRNLGTAEDRCVRPRRDYYVNYRLTFPKSLKPGPYDLLVSQTDLGTGETVRETLPVDVHAEAPPASH